MDMEAFEDLAIGDTVEVSGRYCGCRHRSDDSGPLPFITTTTGFVIVEEDSSSDDSSSDDSPVGSPKDHDSFGHDLSIPMAPGSADSETLQYGQLAAHDYTIDDDDDDIVYLGRRYNPAAVRLPSDTPARDAPRKCKSVKSLIVGKGVRTGSAGVRVVQRRHQCKEKSSKIKIH